MALDDLDHYATAANSMTHPECFQSKI